MDGHVITVEPESPVDDSAGSPVGGGALRRVGIGFASDGSHAAGLVAAGDSGVWRAELWRLDDPSGVHTVPLPGAGARGEGVRSQLLALPDGRVLVCRHEDGDWHSLVLLMPPAGEGDGAGGSSETAGGADRAPEHPAPAQERLVGRVRAPGMRILAVPGAESVGSVIALVTDARPVTTVWRVRLDPVDPGSAPAEEGEPGPALAAAPPSDAATDPVLVEQLAPGHVPFGTARPPEPAAAFSKLAEVPGLCTGGVWLDGVGRRLALDRVREGIVKTIALDLLDGGTAPLLEIAPGSNDRLLLADPSTGLLVVRSDAPGEDRIGWAALGSDSPVRFPDCLRLPETDLLPLATEPGTEGNAPGDVAVAVQLDRGVASGLALWHPGTGRLVEVAVPAGRLGGVGHWSAEGLRVPFCSPDAPTAMATVGLDTAEVLACGGRADPSRWRVDGAEQAVPPQARSGPPPAVAVIEVDGAEGPLQALVHAAAGSSPTGWRTAEHLVVALHGGPSGAWRLDHDPTLRQLAAGGVTVLAPNQRGSTGYGRGFAEAIRGDWGGPDLDDVLAVIESLALDRAEEGLQPPALLGIGYGAFLALLAAGTAPQSVARCAAIAPFLSGARLLAEGSLPVRTMVAKLGGNRREAEAGAGVRAGADTRTEAEPDRRAGDVLKVCERMRGPLLIMHGEQDEVVPVSQSRTLRQRLLRHGRMEGVDFRCVEVSHAGHEVLAGESGPLLRGLLGEFLRTGRLE